jgi:hypothetical protein
LRPSGAFLSTVLDLAKWDAALYEDRVLTKASRDAMWTPVRLTGGASYGYGFGWTLDSLDGHWQVSHGGSLPGFRAELARFPKDSLTVIVLTNADGARPDEIAESVARIYLSTTGRPATRGSPDEGAEWTEELPPHAEARRPRRPETGSWPNPSAAPKPGQAPGPATAAATATAGLTRITPFR